MHTGEGRALTKSIRSSSMIRFRMSITAPGASISGQMLPMVACSCRVSLQGTKSCSIRFTASYLPEIIMPWRKQDQSTGSIHFPPLSVLVYTEDICADRCEGTTDLSSHVQSHSAYESRPWRSGSCCSNTEAILARNRSCTLMRSRTTRSKR